MVASTEKGLYFERVAVTYSREASRVLLSGMRSKSIRYRCKYELILLIFIHKPIHEYVFIDMYVEFIYVCIHIYVHNIHISDHETVFESRDTRKQRGAAVDGPYIPLSDNRYLTKQVIEGKGSIGIHTNIHTYILIITYAFLAGLYGNIWCISFDTLVCHLYKKASSHHNNR
jgi:hypothetical protein